MTIAEIIKAAREAKSWSQADLAKLVGVSRNAVTQWESGESAPKRKRQAIVAKALDLPLNVFNPLHASGVTVVDEAERKVVMLPLHNMNTITMRSGGELKSGESDESVAVDAECNPSNCIVARITDEAMSPLYQLGDVIVIDRTIPPRDKDSVVAAAPGQVLMLRDYRSLGMNSRGVSVYELRSTNPDYPTIPMDSVKGLRVVGVVIEHRRRRRRS